MVDGGGFSSQLGGCRLRHHDAPCRVHHDFKLHRACGIGNGAEKAWSFVLLIVLVMGQWRNKAPRKGKATNSGKRTDTKIRNNK